VECKHLLGKREVVSASESWQCLAPSNVVRVDVSLVTGVAQHALVTPNCRRAREDTSACGPDGKWFEKYEPPVWAPTSHRPRTGGTASADALLAELENTK